MKDYYTRPQRKLFLAVPKSEIPMGARSLGTVFYKSPLINAREIKCVTDQKQSGNFGQS